METGKQSNTNVYSGKQSDTKHIDKDMDKERDGINYQQIASMYNDINKGTYHAA